MPQTEGKPGEKKMSEGLLKKKRNYLGKHLKEEFRGERLKRGHKKRDAMENVGEKCLGSPS